MNEGLNLFKNNEKNCFNTWLYLSNRNQQKTVQNIILLKELIVGVGLLEKSLEYF